MSESFYNTNDLAGAELRQAQLQAATQEQLVEAIFRSSTRSRLTPEGVLVWMPTGTPLTSVRRAMTNLTKAGRLVKLSQFARGQYGKPIHYWALAQPMQPQADLFTRDVA